MKVKDKVFVVTGGGNGVGRSLVLSLLSRGARVAAVDINPQALEETAQSAGEHGERLSIHIANVADRDSVQALPEQVLAYHGAVDGIINSAGIIHPFGSLNDTGYDTIQRVMRVNFFGTLYMVKVFLPYLASRPEAHITNISSMGALFPVPGETVYGASKAAVKLLTEGLSAELRTTKIRVMAVFPGGITSNIMGNSGVGVTERFEQLRNKFAFLLLTPQKAAEIIIKGIERSRRRLSPGIDSTVLGFLCRMSPRLAPRMIYRIFSDVLRQA